MIHLLDTDTLIFMIRGLKSTRRPAHRQRAQRLVDRCRGVQQAGHPIGLSAVTVSELEFGAQKSGRYDAEIGSLRKLLAPFETYDYDSVFCPPHYGRVRHELEARGMAVGGMDLMIAAHALALEATLVTNNLAHFSRVTGLKTVNWLIQTS